VFGPDKRSAEGAEIEGVEEGRVWGGDGPSPADWEVWRSVVNSPSGSVAEPRRKTSFGIFRA